MGPFTLMTLKISIKFQNIFLVFSHFHLDKLNKKSNNIETINSI